MATPMNMLQRRLFWEWQRHSQRLPWAAGLATLLLAAAAVTGLAAWQAWQEKSQPEVVQAVPRATTPSSPETEARQNLDHYYQSLPPAHSLSAPVMALLRLGDKHGVHFTQGEYHSLPDADSQIVKADIVLPAEAAPADIQAFLRDALQSLRALTVSGIAFERDNANATQVKARIHFVLITRAS